MLTVWVLKALCGARLYRYHFPQQVPTIQKQPNAVIGLWLSKVQALLRWGKVNVDDCHSPKVFLTFFYNFQTMFFLVLHCNFIFVLLTFWPTLQTIISLLPAAKAPQPNYPGYFCDSTADSRAFITNCPRDVFWTGKTRLVVESYNW